MAKPKVILLTGGTGFLGSYLAHRNLVNGHKMIFIVRKKGHLSAHQRAMEAMTKINAAHHFTEVDAFFGDVTHLNLGLNQEQLESLKGKVDEIWHCSGMVSFDQAKDSMTRKVNIEGAKNIIDFAEAIKCSTIHYVSTAYVSGCEWRMFKPSELDASQNFKNGYEESKFHAESIMTRGRKEHNLKITIYRPSIIVDFRIKRLITEQIGYYGFLRAFSIIKTLAMRMAKKAPEEAKKNKLLLNFPIIHIPINIPECDNGLLNFVDTEFIADFMLKCSATPELQNATYNLTNKANVSTTDVINWTTQQFRIRHIKMQSKDEIPNETKMERLFLKGIRNYIPYLNSFNDFDRDLTSSVVEAHHLRECPSFDFKVIKTVCDYFINQIDSMDNQDRESDKSSHAVLN